MTNPSENKPPAKPGLLVEDTQAVEVTDPDGKQRIEKTPDRDQRTRDLREANTGTRPTHQQTNG